MRIAKFRCILLLLFITLFLQVQSAFASRTQKPEFEKADKVFTLFDARVKVMRAVAFDKWMQRSPIEDKKREAAVLKAAQADAKKQGIQNIEPLILAQIEIAKAEQRRWHARWDKRGMDAGTAPDLAKSRKELDRLGKGLLQALKNLLPIMVDPSWQVILKKQFDQKLKALPNAERALLWRALLEARITPR